MLLDGADLRPLALLDGAALTELRTPAVSALAVRALTPDDRPLRLVLFGTGPQAYGHLEAVLAVREVAEAVVVARPGRRARPRRIRADARRARPRRHGRRRGRGRPRRLLHHGPRTPLRRHPGGPGATVVAVGSHEPAARETDTALVTRAEVYVEARSAALREAGDLLVPMAEGRSARTTSRAPSPTW
ncbi:hypothetical protein O1L60_01500 [Streptomyces diastatochromogenes]|nr:hypothetical protein [Streptomyces diastatochromogenes]